MIFTDINFGQIGQIPAHMDGQISHITKMCSFNNMKFMTGDTTLSTHIIFCKAAHNASNMHQTKHLTENEWAGRMRRMKTPFEQGTIRGDYSLYRHINRNITMLHALGD
jgi:hypothetical protein